jgi:hypothetical protein
MASGQVFKRRRNMSRKEPQRNLNKESEQPATMTDSCLDVNQSPIFYLCACPDCEQGELHLFDTGVFEHSDVFGITDEGEIGCYATGLDGKPQLGIYCGDCATEIYQESEQTEEGRKKSLLEWARTHGKAIATLSFVCPECGSRHLTRDETGITFSTEVVSVCEHPTEGWPIVALSRNRCFGTGGTYRYRCLHDHELLKEDGSPVETEQELMQWLKAHQTTIKE